MVFFSGPWQDNDLQMKFMGEGVQGFYMRVSKGWVEIFQMWREIRWVFCPSWFPRCVFDIYYETQQQAKHINISLLKATWDLTSHPLFFARQRKYMTFLFPQRSYICLQPFDFIWFHPSTLTQEYKTWSKMEKQDVQEALILEEYQTVFLLSFEWNSAFPAPLRNHPSADYTTNCQPLTQLFAL